MANKKIWVQGAIGAKPYSWTTRRMVDLGMEPFLLIPECPIIPSTGPAETDPLLELVQRSLMVSNSTESNLTPSCWLCYGTAPSYCEGIAIMGNYTLETRHDQCQWQSKANLTLQKVTGQGFCIGTMPNDTQQMQSNLSPSNLPMKSNSS